tara:strand:+ start:5568 stop:6401 length:834 start_codon:yes stop_codon:yes gene_type:complete
MSYPFGIHTNMSNEDYHSIKEVNGIPVISSTMVKDVCMEDLFYAFNKPAIKNQAILDAGTALHSLYLEGHMPICGGKTRAAKEYKEAVEEAQRTNRIALPSADYKRVMGMHQAMLNNKAMAAFKKRKHAVEQSLFVQMQVNEMDKHQRPHLVCKLIQKARPDMYIKRGGICIDVKTGPKPEPHQMNKHIERMKWHVQAAFYRNVMETLGMPVKRFLFFCVEREYPHRTQVIELPQDLLEYGFQLACGAIDEIADAYKTGVIETGWPSIHTAEFGWME